MSEFKELDNADSNQIVNDSSSQNYVYFKHGKKQISNAGVRKMINDLDDVITIHPVETRLITPTEDRNNWVWFATVIAKNMRTGRQTLGGAQESFMSKTGIEDFGMAKATSKAERNAYRKHLSEEALEEFINTHEAVEIKDSYPQQNRGGNGGSDPPTPAQLTYLTNLGYRGETPKSKQAASALLDALTGKGKR